MMSFQEQIKMHEVTVKAFKESCIPSLEKIVDVCRDALKSGHKILLCGNGGSAADSQHIAAEFVGRFHKERVSLPAIALTTDTSILTAVANDYDYDIVFSRQVEGLGQSGDVLIGISTSGNSVNIIRAVETAKDKGIMTVAFTGEKASKLSEIADITLCAPSNVTARIQECHILAGHLICSAIDEEY
jgi:D-sedoheptulose 7-phosphate isomerase